MVRKARKRGKPLCAKDKYYESAIEQCRSCKIPCSMSKPLCKQFGCQGSTFPVEISFITSSKPLLTNTQESAPPGTVGVNIMTMALIAAAISVVTTITTIGIVHLIKKLHVWRNKDKHRRETDHDDSMSTVDSTTPILQRSMKHQKGKGYVPIKGEDTAPSVKDVPKSNVKTEDASSPGRGDPESGAKTEGIPSPTRVVAQLSVEAEGKSSAGHGRIGSSDRHKDTSSPTLNVVIETRDKNNTKRNPIPSDGISGQVAAESTDKTDGALSPGRAATELRADTEVASSQGQNGPELVGVETESAPSLARVATESSAETEGDPSPGQVGPESGFQTERATSLARDAAETSLDTENDPSPGQVDPESGNETEGTPSTERVTAVFSADTEGAPSPGQVGPELVGVDTEIAPSPARVTAQLSAGAEGGHADIESGDDGHEDTSSPVQIVIETMARSDTQRETQLSGFANEFTYYGSETCVAQGVGVV